MLQKLPIKLASFLIVIATLFFFAPQKVQAAAITWDGGGSDGTCGGAAGDGNKWSCAANWSGDVVPTLIDDVTFNSTSTKDATIDTSSVVDSLTIASGYSGTITQATGVTFEADQGGTAFSQADGTFAGGNSAISISSGGFALSGGTFTSTSGTLSISAAFTMTAGTFNHNSGTVTFDDTVTSTLTCGTATFNLVNFSKGAASVNIVVGSTCTIPLSGTNPVSVGEVINSGVINITGNWTVSDYTQQSGATLNMSGTTLTVNGIFTLNGGTLPSSVTTISTSSDFILNGGTLPVSLTTISIGGGLTNSSNILPNGTALTINGTGGGTFTCGTATFSSVSIARGASSVNVIIGATCNFPLLGTNPSSVGEIFNNGTISVTGNWTTTSYEQNAGGTLTMTGDTLTVTGNLLLNGGSTLPASITSIVINDDFYDPVSLLPANVNLTLTSTSNADITCGTTLGSLTFSRTGGTLTVLSSCTFGSFTQTAGAVANPASAYTWTATGDISFNSTSAFGGANLTLEFSGTATQNLSKTSTGAISSPFLVNKSSGQVKLTSTFVTTSGACTVQSGTLNYNGNNLSCSSITFQSGTTLQAVGTEYFSPTPTLNTGSTYLLVGNGNSVSDTYVFNDSLSYKNFTTQFTDSTDKITYLSSFLATNLAGYWKMDEGSGTVDDSSSNSNIGTLTNATFSSTVPTLKQSNSFSVLFDSSSDYINLGDSLSIAQNKGAVTVAAWIRKVSVSGRDEVFGLSTGTSTSNPRVELATTGDEILCEGRAGDAETTQTVTTTASNLSTATWYHVACTYDYANDQILVYLNGSPQTTTGTVAFTATATANTTSQRSAIGLDEDKAGNNFDGLIDEVVFYDRELSASEVGALAIGFNGSYSLSSLTAAGTYTQAAGEFVSPTTFNVSGNWANTGGTFTPNSGTVVLNGTSQIFSGSTTFYNLTKIVAAADTLTFTAGTTQTITNTTTLQGAASNLLSLRSSSTGNQWSFDPQGTRAISYVDTKDSNNTNGTIIATTGNNITNSGNNTNWDFAGNNTPTISLGTVSPDPTTDTTPSITGTASDSDGTIASVEYQVDSTVGSWSACTADDGTFDEASDAFTCTSSALSDGAHTIYVRTTDNTAGVSTNYSDTFTVDTTAPSVSVTALSPDPTTDTTPTLTGTATDTNSTTSSVEFQMDSTAGAWSACTADDGTFDEAAEAFSCTASALSNGSHTMYFRATDALSNTTPSGFQSDTFTVDTTAPSVSVTALSPDPTTDTTPTLSGTATDTNSTVSNVQFQMDSTAGAWSSCTADDAAFDEASETFTCTASALSDGSHTMYFRATDSAANTTSSGYQSDTFTIDTTAPSISVTALSPDPTTDTTPTVTGTATDTNSTTASVEFQMDGTGGAWSACTADDGTFDEAAEAFSCTASALSDGSHTIYLRATDALSNTTPSGFQSDTFTVDSTAPSVSATAYTPDPTTDTTPTLTGTVTDTTGTVSNLEFQMDSTAGAWSSCTANDGTFDEASETFSCTPTALSDGSHTMYFRATDALSNTTSSGYQFDTFTVDTTAPSVSVTPLTPDPNTDTTPTLTGTATDTNSTTASVEYQIDSTAGAWSACTADDGTFDEAAEAFTCTTSPALSLGSHTMYFRATDALSNTTTSGYQSDTFTISSSDTAAPSITLTPYTPDPTTDATPTVTGTATDASGSVTTVEFQIDSTSGSWTSCTADDGAFDESSETFSCTPSTLTDGSHTIYIRTTDNLNNTTSSGSESSDSFTVDTTAPLSTELISPGQHSYTNNERPTFTWKATTDATTSVSRYSLEIDNPSLGNNQPSGDFTIGSIPTSGTTDIIANQYIVHFEGFSDSDQNNNYISVYTRSSSQWGTEANDGKVREGVVSWKVKAFDAVGSESSSSRTLFVDRTNPNIAVSQVNETPFSSNSFSTSDRTPTIFGTLTDTLSGGDQSQPQGEDGPRVASGPKEVIIKIEKQSGLLYELHTTYTINMDTPWYTCNSQPITDNSKQKCNKYLPFEYIQKENLALGTYRISLIGKDKADNTSSENVFTLNITTFSQVATPEEIAIVEQEIEKESPTLTEEQKTEVIEQIEVTKPNTPTGPSLLSQIQSTTSQVSTNLWQKFSLLLSNISRSIGYGINYIANAFSSTYNFMAYRIPGFFGRILIAFGQFTESTTIAWKNRVAQFAFTIGMQTETISHRIGTGIIKIGYLFMPEPTKIYNSKVERATPTTMTITWTTNHPATSKVNYGLTEDYGQDVQSDEMTTHHELVVEGLQPNTTYYYEVMSQNRDYVYDANHTFTTPAK